MANLTQTIQSRLNVFGGQPSTKWQFTWGSAKWGGETNDLIQSVGKFFQSYGLTLTGGQFSFSQMRVISSSFSPLSETVTEYLKDPANWNFVFPGQVIDNDDRISTAWIDNTNQPSTYVASAPAATSWSEL